MKKVLVLDFGGQYNLLVARRVRECGVYCEIKPYTMSMDDIRAFDPAAIIFTGGPATVFEPNAPALDNAIFELGLPILGICYGQQLMIHQLGGACRRAEVREYGKVELTHDGTSLLFDGIEPTSICWMSHGVEVERLSPASAPSRTPRAAPTPPSRTRKRSSTACSSIPRCCTPSTALKF